MRFRLLAPQSFVTALGVLLVVGLAHGNWGTALLAAAVAAALVAGLGARLLQPIFERLSFLTSSVRGAAESASTPVQRLDGEDELQSAGRVFNELSHRWSERMTDLGREASTLEAVLDGMAEGVWVTDAEGTILRHNRALKVLLGPGKHILGERPLSLVRSTELSSAVDAACQHGEVSQLEVQVEGLIPRTLAIQVMPLGGELAGSAAVFHDVTELRRLEKVRKDFVANVSHELRTPITAIRGYSETLQSGALSDPEHAPRMVEIIHRQSERLAALVSDLLELSRLESGEMKLERTRVNVAEVVERAVDAVRQRAEKKDQALQIHVDRTLAISGDARALEQVLLNLLDNAVKYSPSGERVTVSARREDNRCFVAVSNTGPSIEEKHLARIFERFYRVDKGRSRDTGGTGLGLSIVKHLTGAMGGEIRAESPPGGGATFTVTLPSAPDEAASHPA